MLVQWFSECYIQSNFGHQYNECDICLRSSVYFASVVETIFLRGVSTFSYSLTFKNLKKNLLFSYKVWSVTPRSVDQGKLLLQWEENESIDFWEQISRTGQSSRIMAAPDIQLQFENFLKDNDINYELIIENVERLFEL